MKSKPANRGATAAADRLAASSLIRRLEEACRRPLFVEIALVENAEKRLQQRRQQQQMVYTKQTITATARTKAENTAEGFEALKPASHHHHLRSGSASGLVETASIASSVNARKRTRMPEERREPKTWEEVRTFPALLVNLAFPISFLSLTFCRLLSNFSSLSITLAFG